jgi:hypothetical protein
MSLLIRRGLDADRPSITPQSGEFIYTTDKKELWIGDGVTPGGNLVNSDGSSGSGGVGGKNYVLNPDGAADASDISVTGGVSATRTTTVADLPEPSKGTGIEISITAGAADDYAEFDATNIDDADGGRIGSTVISYKTVSGYTSGDFKAQAYSVTNSRVISEYSIPAGSDTVPFDTAMTSEEDIRVRFVSTVTNSVGLVVSGVTIEPVSQTTAGVTGKWVVSDVDLTNATATTETKYHRINGQNLDVIIQYDGSLSVTSTIQVALPSGYSVDTSIVQDHQVLGEAYGFDSGTAFRVGEVIYKDSVIKLTNDGNSSEWSPTSPHTWASADKLSVKLSVPVAELANAHTPLLSDVQYENAAITAINESGTSYTANTPIPWDSATVLAPGITFDGTDTFTALVKMKVSIPFMRLRSTTSTSLSINVTDTSGTVLTGGEKVIASGTETRHQGGGLLELDAGQEFQFRANNSFTMSSVADENVIKMFRVPDYSARAAGLPISDVANETKQYLLPEYREVTLALNNHYTGGSIRVVKIGNVVTITSNNVATHASGSSTRETTSGFMPDWARPSAGTISNLYVQSGTVNAQVRVESDGTLSTRYLTASTGADYTSATSTLSPINMNYAIY